MTEMTLGQGLLISALGIAIVFFALGIIIAMIKLISAVAGVLDKKTETPSTLIIGGSDGPTVTYTIANGNTAVAVNGAAMVPAKGSIGEVALYDTEPKTAAMIMAIVADELKAPLNELRFISIRAKQ